MLYSKLIDYYERLEATRKKLEKKDIVAELYKHCNEEELPIVVQLSMGGLYPAGQEELGIAREMVRRTIAKTYGAREDEVTKKFASTGDLGLTAEFFAKNKRQLSLGKKDLTINNIFDNLRKLPGISGAGSQERKMALISELLSHASPREAKFIVRTVIGDMRIGVAAGIVRDAIATAFGQEAKEVERIFNIVGDFGLVAQMAKKGKMKAEIVIGRPLRVMLAERSPGLKEALDEFDNPALEIKYDGLRIAVHKEDKEVKIFSRRMEDITKQFPEIVLWSRENIKSKQCIIEGEALAVSKEGEPLPFQTLSRRIQRKYDIEKMMREIPVQVNFFDLLYYSNENFMHKPLKERWNKLRRMIKETPNFRLAEHIETKDYKEANKFYKHSLKIGQEGVIVKNLNAHYQPGKRVGYWLKVKPILETLDCVITEAIAGEGKRAKWLGSFVLSLKDGKGNLVEIGKMGSGTTEKQLEELTKELKKNIIEEKGNTVKVKPKIVVEVGYEEIQKSPKYPSGYALRFPRLINIRYDRSPEDIDSLQRLEKIYRLQRRRR